MYSPVSGLYMGGKAPGCIIGGIMLSTTFFSIESDDFDEDVDDEERSRFFFFFFS
jgi:hypothetical protein